MLDRLDDLEREFASAIPDAEDRAILQDKWGYKNIKRAFICAIELENDPSSAFRLALEKKLRELQNAGM